MLLWEALTSAPQAVLPIFPIDSAFMDLSVLSDSVVLPRYLHLHLTLEGQQR